MFDYIKKYIEGKNVGSLCPEHSHTDNTKNIIEVLVLPHHI